MFKSILSILCFSGLLFSQIQYDGAPKFYENRTMEINFIQIDKSLEVDRNFAPMVFQFGNEYDVDIDVIDNATIITDGNVNTYFLGIESRDAYAVGINFNQFHLTPNSKLFLYDEEQTFYMGLFDSRNNKPNDVLTTSLIKSDRIIIELTVPIQELNDLQLNIDTIIHDYTDIKNYFNTLDDNREDCNINVICEEGDGWRDQIDGVIRVQMGGGLCSGSIINNTANDRTPYVLFADHCVSGSASGYVFDFNYQSSTCNGTTAPLNQSISGSQVLAQEDINSGPDFALLEMTSNIPDSYNPFYVGWSRASSPPQDAVGIHHPGADIKKISFTGDNVTANGYYWEFQYELGRVIPGSSGSPFFDENKRQVGIASYIYTNYCDPSPDCYCSQQYDHGYGRFDLAWDMGLSNYLDPLNTGVQTLDGISISGISILHEAYDDMSFESNSLSFNANVSAYTGTIDGVELYYDLGDGFVSQEMEQTFSDNYQTSIGGLYDGMIIEYYIMAVNTEGIIQTFPSNAPQNTVLFVLGELPDLYVTNFEENVTDWVVGDANDTATAGLWELAEPVASYNDQGNMVQPGEDNSEYGTYCFITGNGYQLDETTGQNSASFDDVDGGYTTLYSPEFNFEGLDEVILTYWRWYTNNVGDNGGTDKWIVSVTDNGSNWIDLENTSSSDLSWSKQRFILSDFIDLGSNITFRFVAEDILYSGDAGSGGSLVEAGLDDFKLEYLGSGSGILGDVNNDESIDVLDVVLIVNMILGNESPNYATADINSDGAINVQDIISLINIILG